MIFNIAKLQNENEKIKKKIKKVETSYYSVSTIIIKNRYYSLILGSSKPRCFFLSTTLR